MEGRARARGKKHSLNQKRSDQHGPWLRVWSQSLLFLVPIILKYSSFQSHKWPWHEHSCYIEQKWETLIGWKFPLSKRLFVSQPDACLTAKISCVFVHFTSDFSSMRIAEKAKLMTGIKSGAKMCICLRQNTWQNIKVCRGGGWKMIRLKSVRKLFLLFQNPLWLALVWLFFFFFWQLTEDPTDGHWAVHSSEAEPKHPEDPHPELQNCSCGTVALWEAQLIKASFMWCNVLHPLCPFPSHHILFQEGKPLTLMEAVLSVWAEDHAWPGLLSITCTTGSDGWCSSLQLHCQPPSLPVWNTSLNFAALTQIW